MHAHETTCSRVKFRRSALLIMAEGDIASGEFTNMHIAEENQTPRQIADKVGCDVKDIILINKEQYPGLREKAKLKGGTSLVVPYDGLKDAGGTGGDWSSEPVNSEVLFSLYKALRKLDVNKFFALPVDDEDAPLYSVLIKSPMTFQRMRRKLENGEYSTLSDLQQDFVLLCKNAIVYNDSETEVAGAAHILLSAGFKLFESMAPKPALPEVHEEKEPDGRFKWNHGDDKISLGILTNNPYRKDVPTLGEALFGASTIRIGVTQPTSRTWQTAIPATSLGTGLFESFGVSYDGSSATVDPRRDFSLADKSFESIKDEVKPKVQHDPWMSALKISSIVNSLNVHAKSRESLNKVCSVEVPSGLDTNTQSKTLPTISTSNDQNAKKIDLIPASETSGQDQDRHRKNFPDLANLHRLQEARLLSDSPSILTHDEIKTAKAVRESLMRLIKQAKPKDVISRSAVRAAIGVKTEVDSVKRTTSRDNILSKRKNATGRDVMKLVKKRAKSASTVSSEETVDFCQNCGGRGPRWRGSCSVNKQLCHTCGSYLVANGRPRPIMF